MHRFIGKKAPEKPTPTLTEQAQTLDSRGGTMDQRIAKLDKELLGFKKQLAATSAPSAKAAIKQRAMGVMKRKRMLEKQRDSLAQQTFNLEQQVRVVARVPAARAHALPRAGVTGVYHRFAEVHRGHGQGDEGGRQDFEEGVQGAGRWCVCARTAGLTRGAGKIEDLQDDLADLMLDADEVNEVMGRAYGLPDDVYEEDLDAELAALDEDEFAVEEHEEVPDYLKASEMPSAPSAAPASAPPVAEGAVAAKTGVAL
jgi:charged multivesicular body protein 5